jgi:hypothetical protein
VLYGDKKAASNWYTMCSYCVNICLFSFSVVSWWVLHGDKKAASNWDTMCSYCVRVQCDKEHLFFFCRENWWKLMPCLLMLFIAVNMIVSAIVCKWVLNIVSATVCMGASVWNICVCAPINVVWAAEFVTDYWNTCCSLWCVAIGVHIYKLCLFCEVSIESPVTVLGIQYLLLFRWFLYMLVCTVMVIRKGKKVGQGILTNRMRTKNEKIHVRIY